MKGIVVVPTYNERENLPRLVAEIWTHCPELAVLVVDDNSPDGTGALADELAYQHPGRFFVLHRKEKNGLGRAYRRGFAWVLERDYDFVFQMDADLSHPPSAMPAMQAALRDADLAIGSRYYQGTRVVNWSWWRLALSKMGTVWVNLMTGLSVTDATAGFKCWRANALRAIQADFATGAENFFLVESKFLARLLGMRIAEVPITFYDREMGESKIGLAAIVEALVGSAKLGWRKRALHRLLKPHAHAYALLRSEEDRRWQAAAAAAGWEAEPAAHTREASA